MCVKKTGIPLYFRYINIYNRNFFFKIIFIFEENNNRSGMWLWQKSKYIMAELKEQ